jgi:hypothetical protein
MATGALRWVGWLAACGLLGCATPSPTGHVLAYAPDQPLVCENRSQTGSHVERAHCRTAVTAERERAAAEELMRQAALRAYQR